MASGQDIRITDVPFSSVPNTNTTVFINDNGRLRQTDLTTIAKYSELYTAIIDAHNAGLQSLETTKAQLEQALVNLTNEKFEIINRDHAENLAELTALYENSMQNINALIENGHTKLLNDIEAVDDLRANAATICEEVFTKHTAIAPTTKGNMLLKNVKGDSYQKQLSGKNLYNVKDTKQVNDSTVDEDGWITVTVDNTNGTSSKWANYYTNVNSLLKPSTQYAIVVEVDTYNNASSLVIASSDPNNHICDQFKNEFFLYKAGIHIGLYTTRDDFESTEELVRYGLRTFVTIKAGKKATVKYRISILEDTTVTADTFTYEPYCGGIPSPNPDYPQEIESVGDSGSVVVKAVGKNILDGNAFADYLVSVAGANKNEANKTVSWSCANAQNKIKWLKNYQFKENTQYTIILKGRNNNESSNYVNLRIVYTDGSMSTDSNFPVYGNYSSVYVITESGKTVDYISDMYSSDGTTLLYEECGIFEGVATETDFSHYTENTITIPLTEPLRAVGEVKDEIVLQNGMYGVLRKIGEVDLGDLTWGWTTTNRSDKFRPTAYGGLQDAAKPTSNDTRTRIMCEKYTKRTENETYLCKIGISLDTSSRVNIYDEDFITKEQINSFSTFIKGTKFIYELETPVFEPFEDQIPFYELMAYDEVTNISIVCGDNLSPSATVMYPGTEAGALAIIAYADAKKAHIELKKHEKILEDFGLVVLKKEDIVDNLESESANLPLSANQGRVLKGLLGDQVTYSLSGTTLTITTK